MCSSPWEAPGRTPCGAWRRHTHPAARARASRPVRLFAPALRPGHEPAIDPLRETLVMSLRMHLGRRGSLLTDRPAGLRLVRNEHPVLLAAEMAALRAGAGAQVVTLDATWSAAAGAAPDALRTALTGCVARPAARLHEGARIGDSERPGGRPRTRAAPDAPGRGGRTPSTCSKAACGRDSVLSAEAGDAWDVHHFAALDRYGAEAVHPCSRSSRCKRKSPRTTRAPGSAPPRRRASSRSFRRWASRHSPPTAGAQIFEALGLGAEVIDRCLTGTVSTIRRDRVRRDRRGRPGAPPGRPSGSRLRGGVARPWARALPPRRRGSRLVAHSGAGHADRG